MTKSDLIEKVQGRLKDYPKKDVAFAVDIMFQAMTDSLARNERIEVRGFGNFTVRSRDSRKGRNPKTGTEVNIPSKKVPFFKVGKDLKKLVDY
ncbi:MAG: integration host factor subunit beta [Proteobacteria bacterium]|nr:integration host factor subunit beta [Pseudomonadota bacterium]